MINLFKSLFLYQMDLVLGLAPGYELHECHTYEDRSTFTVHTQTR